MALKCQDLPTRRHYQRLNPCCELRPWLELYVPHMVTARHDRRPTQTHHLFHTGGRFDVWSNLITVSSVIHPTWVHETCPVDAKVLCLQVKFRKGELNLAELNRAAGAMRPDAQPVLAWLTSCHPQHPWAQHMARELVAALQQQTLN